MITGFVSVPIRTSTRTADPGASGSRKRPRRSTSLPPPPTASAGSTVGGVKTGASFPKTGRIERSIPPASSRRKRRRGGMIKICSKFASRARDKIPRLASRFDCTPRGALLQPPVAQSCLHLLRLGHRPLRFLRRDPVAGIQVETTEQVFLEGHPLPL